MLLDYNIRANHTLNAVYQYPGGMPKKGVRKPSKQQKVHEMRAKVQYATTQFPMQQGAQPVVQQISQQGFISNAIQNMSLQQLQELDAVAQDVTRSDRLSKAIIDHFVPQISQLKTQQEHIENTIKALEEGFELGFVEEYYEGHQFQVEVFYERVSDRIDTLTAQAAVNAAVAAAQAAAPSDAMIEG